MRFSEFLNELKKASELQSSGSVGVRLSPEAKKNKKNNDARLKAYSDHVSTSGFNTSYGKKRGIETDLSKSLKGLQDSQDTYVGRHRSMLEAKSTPAHLMKTASTKPEKVKGLVDFKDAMTAIGGTKKIPNDENKLYYSKGGLIVGKWDPLTSMGYIYKPSLKEGMFVVKNKDGKEKRFKDHNSAEAKAFKDSKAPSKVKLAAYSAAYWKSKDADPNFEGVVPWERIKEHEVSDQFDGIARQQGLGRVEDWTISGGRGYVEADGIKQVASVTIRMMFSFGKEDDLGLDIEGDERVSDSQYVKLRRDTKNPKKLVFAGYV